MVSNGLIAGKVKSMTISLNPLAATDLRRIKPIEIMRRPVVDAVILSRSTFQMRCAATLGEMPQIQLPNLAQRRFVRIHPVQRHAEAVQAQLDRVQRPLADGQILQCRERVGGFLGMFRALGDFIYGRLHVGIARGDLIHRRGDVGLLLRRQHAV
jgi:hypothetical protein